MPDGTQGLFLILHSEITAGNLLGLYGVYGSEPMLAVCKANIFPAVLCIALIYQQVLN